MKHCYVLQHSYEIDGHDETKFIGVYSTNELAEAAVSRLESQPGFKYKPDCFFIDKYELDKDHWTEGYSTMIAIQVKDKNNSWMIVHAKCLPDKQYQIFELLEAELLGEFKHLDIVECEERDNYLYAIKLVSEGSRPDS